MIRVYGRAVGNNQDVVCGGHGHHTLSLRDAPNPRNVRLQHIDAAAADEFSETISCVLVFRGGQQHGAAKGVLDLLVAIIVILHTRKHV
jgi:hypothetical protein